MTYLLQVDTKDFGLQLRTEVVADTIEQLVYEAKRMVKENPAVKGLAYGIWKITRENGKAISTIVKQDKISK